MGSVVSNPSFSWPSPPLITKTGWVSHPTPPLLKLWIPQEDQQINQPRAHDFCFSCALEREHFWHFSYFYLFFSSFQLTDCFLLLVFPFFLTHCIILTLCLIPVCSGNKNCIIWYGILIFRPGNKNVIPPQLILLVPQWVLCCSIWSKTFLLPGHKRSFIATVI